MKNNVHNLKNFYIEKEAICKRFCNELSVQITYLLSEAKIQLAAPVEFRVKSWPSIVEKCETTKFSPKNLDDIKDLSGMRIVLLFKRDQDKALKLIEKHFNVISIEDTTLRLSVDKFGYGSIHLDLMPKKEWLEVPTFKGFRDLKFELQIRTASQHIWAAASHMLQYKQPKDVPLPIIRSISRAAALLELVDIEFERVLSERDLYTSDLNKINEDEILNIDNLKRVLNEELPSANANESGDDPFSDLLDELFYLNVKEAKGLRNLLKKHHDKIIAYDKERVMTLSKEEIEEHKERYQKGVFYTHVGLSRKALSFEFGKKFDDYLSAKSKARFEVKKA